MSTPHKIIILAVFCIAAGLTSGFAATWLAGKFANQVDPTAIFVVFLGLGLLVNYLVCIPMSNWIEADFEDDPD